ncbi:hypothetical protein ANME2D_00498 [Candidatus Methanoperedens nitroreducens]|uniref:Uncharacterized protein n=1 Tax=Candidatus Methanoperedens nitratireducens TaxID=1392998 RepID=A0A062V839_9EURY|nr:PxKF domain-containing protein [Candidatus Methanoperedens nitroreducens]KCZ73432.1 hypothetical protein ANME2D_00498 [Candidatus Methanoperedens nitroreducens]MDJ1422613.1 PxKF domain-containing protein [Candidatus Methanoperedens sp.]
MSKNTIRDGLISIKSSLYRGRTQRTAALSVVLIIGLMAWAAVASDADVSVVDVTAPIDSVELAPGQSEAITINISVSGKQNGTATFEVYRDWTLSGGVFTGSNPEEFTVSPREAQDPANNFSTSGNVSVAAGETPGGPYTLAIGVFNITNTNPTGAKLGARYSSAYNVTVVSQLSTYTFSGFFRPVENPPILNVVKAGSAIPVKFSLDGDQGLDIFAEGYPKSELITCGSIDIADGIDETITAGSSSLSYNATTDQYNYVWKTDKTWTDTCRQLVVKLDDGTSHIANFKFSK